MRYRNLLLYCQVEWIAVERDDDDDLLDDEDELVDKVVARFEDMTSNAELTTRLVNALALRSRQCRDWVLCVRHLGVHIRENRMEGESSLRGKNLRKELSTFHDLGYAVTVE